MSPCNVLSIYVFGPCLKPNYKKYIFPSSKSFIKLLNVFDQNCLSMPYLTRKDFRHQQWHQLFHGGGRYHIETELCWANQWTGFYMITASVMKELKQFKFSVLYCHRCWQNFYVSFSEQLNVKNCKLETKKLHRKFKNVIM